MPRVIPERNNYDREDALLLVNKTITNKNFGGRVILPKEAASKSEEIQSLFAERLSRWQEHP